MGPGGINTLYESQNKINFGLELNQQIKPWKKKDSSSWSNDNLSSKLN